MRDQPNRIELKEWGKPTDLELTLQEARAARLLAHRLDVEWLDRTHVRIGPKAGFVGMAALSPRLHVMVRPKAPVRALLDLIALAYRTAPMPPAIGDASFEKTGPSEWLAWLLVLEIEQLLRMGLRNGYVVIQEGIPFVRGRLQFAASHRMIVKPWSLECEFSDFLADTPENRILRGTLEILAMGHLGRELRARTATVLRSLDSVTLVRPTLAMFSSVSESRLNRYYAPALRLCRLFLEGSGLELNLGDVIARSFFVPMERVFQLALTNALRECLGAAVHSEPSFGGRFDYVAGEPDLGVTIRPDVVIGSLARPSFLLDAKYANPIGENRGQPTFSNPNLYQLASYCRALGCDGCLVYPQFDVSVGVTYRLKDSVLGIRAVNLDLPGAAGLRSFAREITALRATNHESRAMGA